MDKVIVKIDTDAIAYSNVDMKNLVNNNCLNNLIYLKNHVPGIIADSLWDRKSAERKTYINIDNIDKFRESYVSRIFKLKYFIKSIKEDTNFLPGVEKWDDPWENFYLKADLKKGIHHGKWDKLLKNNYFGQCWMSLSSIDEDPYFTWMMYRDKNKKCFLLTDSYIKVVIKVKHLIDSFKNAFSETSYLQCYIGKIRYMTEEEIQNKFDCVKMNNTSNSDIIEALFVKRENYKEENEVRLIYQKHKELKPHNKYKLEWKSKIRRIILDPVNNTNHSTIRNKLVNSGIEKQLIVKSKIEDIPKLKLNIQ